MNNWISVIVQGILSGVIITLLLGYWLANDCDTQGIIKLNGNFYKCEIIKKEIK